MGVSLGLCHLYRSRMRPPFNDWPMGCVLAVRKKHLGERRVAAAGAVIGSTTVTGRSERLYPSAMRKTGHGRVIAHVCPNTHPLYQERESAARRNPRVKPDPVPGTQVPRSSRLASSQPGSPCAAADRKDAAHGVRVLIMNVSPVRFVQGLAVNASRNGRLSNGRLARRVVLSISISRARPVIRSFRAMSVPMCPRTNRGPDMYDGSDGDGIDGAKTLLRFVTDIDVVRARAQMPQKSATHVETEHARSFQLRAPCATQIGPDRDRSDEYGLCARDGGGIDGANLAAPRKHPYRPYCVYHCATAFGRGQDPGTGKPKRRVGRPIQNATIFFWDQGATRRIRSGGVDVQRTVGSVS
ncbi:hypothetical protein HD554DRAFT_2040021 [Boletus coccyginus]|nr:hypothetical protein HD554DRAFT_2040021 [Boletus coccyginus]